VKTKLKGDSTDADNRLKEFLQGLRSTQLKDEGGEIVEHWYDPEANKQYTLQEIAEVMGVSRERVRQIEEEALRKMWRYLSIMNKREGLTSDDWMQIVNQSHNGEATIFMP
jgi:DNA-directed RNA polymerase sigma subunit (sigma70/sigma32)